MTLDAPCKGDLVAGTSVQSTSGRLTGHPLTRSTQLLLTLGSSNKKKEMSPVCNSCGKGQVVDPSSQRQRIIREALRLRVNLSFPGAIILG